MNDNDVRTKEVNIWKGFFVLSFLKWKIKHDLNFNNIKRPMLKFLD